MFVLISQSVFYKSRICLTGSIFPVVSKKLNQAPLPIVPYETCSKPIYWWDSVRPSMVCAGYESPDELKSACQVCEENRRK